MWRLHPAAVAVEVACALWVCGNTLAKRTLKRRPSWTQLKSSLTITWGRPFFQNTLRYHSVGYTPDDILENILVMVRFICIFWTRPHHIVGNSIYPSKYLHLYPLYPLVSYPGKYPLVSEILNSNCINIPEDISQPTGWYQTATIISMVFPQTDRRHSRGIPFAGSGSQLLQHWLAHELHSSMKWTLYSTLRHKLRMVLEAEKLPGLSSIYMVYDGLCMFMFLNACVSSLKDWDLNEQKVIFLVGSTQIYWWYHSLGQLWWY